VCEVLEGLPSKFRFETRQLLDQRATRISQEIDRAAVQCKSPGSLLLIYYFGHGKRDPNGLAFVHRGTSKGNRETLTFQSMFHRVRAGEPSGALFLLDCCYAGAAGKQIAGLPENEYCLVACTTASTRALWENRGDTPIGVFSSTLLDGFFSPAAAVSNVDDRITVESLFDFVKRETIQLTDGVQEPYMAGKLTQQLSLYSEAPVIIPGVTTGISLKSAYSKLRVIVSVVGRRTFPDLHTLYLAALSHDRRVFLTNYVDADGRISQRPANWTVLRRYASFLRAIKVVDLEDLRLTPRGEELIEDPEQGYNLKLLRLLDAYLDRCGLSRDALKAMMQRVLQRRWFPTRANVLSDVTLLRRPVNEQHMGLVLDLLGHIGVIGTLKRKEQVYFPWGAVQVTRTGSSLEPS
jgi:hypothetical protein